MYHIEIANQQSLIDIDETLISDVATKTLEAEETAAAEISIALVDDTTIHQLNHKHLNHDYPTDVISFLFDSEFEGDNDSSSLRGRHKRIDGEIIISTETAIAKAAELNCDAHHELLLYVIHGLLHLVGYDDMDDDERKLMRSRERDILELCHLSPGVDS